MTPAVTREMTITDTIGGDKASNSDPKAVIYLFEPAGFPNVPLIQPRLNSVEEWKITNQNNDAHPMHIHVNDFQVTAIDDPNRGKTGVQPWGVDNVNVPAPIFNDMHVVSTPASLTLRQEFLEYPGTYVIHCHRLNHEDNGLMATISVIPEVSTYAVAIPGSNGKPASVQVRDGNGDKVLQTVFPFPDFEGTPVGRDVGRQRRRYPRPARRHRQGGIPAGCRVRRQQHQGRRVQDGAHPLRPVRCGLQGWGDGRRCRHRRKRIGRQHHRRLRPGDGVADQGVLVDRAERIRQGPRRVLRVHAVPRLRVGSDAGDRNGRIGLRTGEHRHGARPGGRTAGEDVPVGPVHARRPEHRPTAPHRNNIRASRATRG